MSSSLGIRDYSGRSLRQGVEQRILKYEGFQPRAGDEILCLLWSEEEMGLN